MTNEEPQETEGMQELIKSAWSRRMPTMSHDEFDAMFKGMVPLTECENMTYGKCITFQLIVQASRGDNKAIAEVLDRLVGKASQTTKNLNVTQDYNAFLDNLAKKDDVPEIEGE